MKKKTEEKLAIILYDKKCMFCSKNRPTHWGLCEKCSKTMFTKTPKPFIYTSTPVSSNKIFIANSGSTSNTIEISYIDEDNNTITII